MTAIVLQFLANSLWVGVLAAAFAAAGCALLPRPALRHRICCLALAATALVPIAQFLAPASAVPTTQAFAAPMLFTSSEPPPAPIDWSPVVWIWATGAAAFALLLGWRISRALRAKRGAAWVGSDLLARRNAWRAGLRPGRDGDFLESQQALSPFAVGWLSPAVIFPNNLDGRLEDDDLRRLWLHESAHLRRFDDWTALAVEALGAALFYHPAAWWLRRRIAAEREYACDELAARSTGSVSDYALTLTRFAELQLPQPLAGELGFAGSPGLRRRITMLFEDSRHSGARRPAWALGVAGVGLAVLLALGPKVSLAQQEPPAAPAAPVAPVAPAEPAVPATPAVPARVAEPVKPSPVPRPEPAPNPEPSPRPVIEPPPLPDVGVDLQIPSIPEIANEVAEHMKTLKPELDELRELHEKMRVEMKVDTAAIRRQAHEMAQAMKEQMGPELRRNMERMREDAERLEESLPSAEMRKRLEEQARRIETESRVFREKVQRMEVEMARLQREMQPAIERHEQAMKEHAEELEQRHRQRLHEAELQAREHEKKRREHEEELHERLHEATPGQPQFF